MFGDSPLDYRDTPEKQAIRAERRRVSLNGWSEVGIEPMPSDSRNVFVMLSIHGRSFVDISRWIQPEGIFGAFWAHRVTYNANVTVTHWAELTLLPIPDGLKHEG